MHTDDTDSEREGNDFKGFQGFNVKAKDAKLACSVPQGPRLQLSKPHTLSPKPSTPSTNP
jgi:hypothetical protein